MGRLEWILKNTVLANRTNTHTHYNTCMLVHTPGPPTQTPPHTHTDTLKQIWESEHKPRSSRPRWQRCNVTVWLKCSVFNSVIYLRQPEQIWCNTPWQQRAREHDDPRGSTQPSSASPTARDCLSLEHQTIHQPIIRQVAGGKSLVDN